jgi:hypothetical protein
MNENHLLPYKNNRDEAMDENCPLHFNRIDDNELLFFIKLLPPIGNKCQ